MPLGKFSWAVALIFLMGCKSPLRAMESTTLAQDTLNPNSRLGVEVRLTLDYEGREEFVSYRSVARLLDSHCVSCHGTGTDLDLSHFPFRSRFPSQDELMKTVLIRLREADGQMPPAPKARLSDEEIALVERWTATLQLSETARSPDPGVFQGAALKVQWREDGGMKRGEWNQSWDGRAVIKGILSGVPLEGALNLKLSVLGEDGQPVLEKTFFRVNRDAVVLEGMVREADLRKRLLAADSPKPGGSGVMRTERVGRDEIAVTWEKAADVQTDEKKLLYSLYVSEKDSVGNLSSMQSFGVPAVSGLNLLTATVKHLKMGMTYHFNVVVSDEHGRQAIYKPLLQSTLPDTIAPDVSSGQLSVASLTSTTARVRWPQAEDDWDRSDELTYAVYLSAENNIGDVFSALRNGRQAGAPLNRTLETIVDGLEGGKTYFVTVLVKDRGGNTSAYRMSQVTMPASPPGRSARRD